jgi:hypothetical protein
MRALAVILVATLAAAALGWQQTGPTKLPIEPTNPGPRFVAVDVFVDSGATPLGAWQVEIKTVFGRAAGAHPTAKLVGVEGGEAAAYKQPPYYDPAALHESQIQERIVLAAFSTDVQGMGLPTGTTRVARLHVQVTGGAEPEYVVKLMTAGAADGTKIEAKATTAPATGTGDGR